MDSRNPSNVELLSNPITGFADCCACAARGQVAANAPTRSDMNCAAPSVSSRLRTALRAERKISHHDMAVWEVDYIQKGRGYRRVVIGVNGAMPV